MVSRDILKGVVDMHLHPGPSVVNRSLDAVEMLREAEDAGYRAFVIKDHYLPTTMNAQLVEKTLSKKGTRVIGTITLNNSVHGFNLRMVDVAAAMGAKIIWMPTVSALQHQREAAKNFPGQTRLSVPDEPIYYLDGNGELKSEVVALLEYLTSHPDIVLATGHGSPEEIDALLEKGFKMGLKKIVVTHPYLIVNASYEQVKRWAEMGAYIELTAGCFKGVLGLEYPLSLVTDYMQFVPEDHLVMCSDGGVTGKDGTRSPVEMLYRFINMLMEQHGLTESQIRMMTQETPAKLLGLNLKDIRTD
jgi:hypothetical protein